MQVSSSAKQKHGTITSLTTLYARHQSAVVHFKEALSSSLDQNTQELVHSLIGLHEDCGQTIRKWIDDLPDSPVKPNRDLLSPAADKEPTDWSNEAKVRQHLLRHTQETHALYRQMLDNDGIPAGIKDLLESQAQGLSDSIHKLERLLSTGAARDMQV
ncbi:MAG: hypothetical protein D6772_12170 [Bacteroidetes bacterium]|nr:MAG: hypothetical protein D6772_12170 [Bacteroidota bacterium]